MDASLSTEMTALYGTTITSSATRDPDPEDCGGVRYIVQGAQVTGQSPAMHLWKMTGPYVRPTYLGKLLQAQAGVTLPGTEAANALWECAGLKYDPTSSKFLACYSSKSGSFGGINSSRRCVWSAADCQTIRQSRKRTESISGDDAATTHPS